ncbi:MAG: chromate resistance protein ChrB domain-containing protein [Pseudomonadota bacterium]
MSETTTKSRGFRTNPLRRCLVGVLFAAGCSLAALADDGGARLATWEPWEPDTAVAAWVLARFVDPNLRFESYPRGTRLQAVEALDTPDARYRRSARETATEAVVRIHRVAQPCLGPIVEWVRVIEIGKWSKAAVPQAEAFEAGLVARLPQGQSGPVDVGPVFEWLDRQCSALQGAE